jgi:three-Cys-motif partner protein
VAKKTEYVTDPSDGLRAMVVGAWGKEKYTILRDYIQSSHGARRKWPQHCFVDLYCGPGRIQYKGEGGFEDGGAITAWRQSQASSVPFTQVFISDMDSENVESCAKRLRVLGAPVSQFVGKAVDVAAKVAREMPHGMHLAYLDPFSLGAMPFDVVKPLVKLPKLDLIANYSAYDQARNLDRMMIGEIGDLDAFAPGWRSVIDAQTSIRSARIKLVNYWRSLLVKEGIQYSEEMPEFLNARNGLLYWLIFASHNPLGDKLWKSINDSNQPSLFAD